ncbi:peptide transporter, partial [Francisella tularensis subsp. holarctica]|nr:peptide transporter [Francisella tularensis subsp. holarctica]
MCKQSIIGLKSTKFAKFLFLSRKKDISIKLNTMIKDLKSKQSFKIAAITFWGQFATYSFNAI